MSSRLFDVIAIAYAVVAVLVGVRLFRRWKTTFDDSFTPRDRALISAMSFYLLIPFAVLFHELGHAAACWLLGGKITEFHYMIYWAYVVPKRSPEFLPLEMVLIAAAGNVVSLIIGIVPIVSVMRRPRNAALNFLRLEFGRLMLVISLLFYPLLSLLMQGGDFWIMRDRLNMLAPHAGDAAVGVYIALGVAVALLWRSRAVKERRFSLTSPLRDRRRRLEAQLEKKPEEPNALRQMARVEVAEQAYERAMPLLDRLIQLVPNEPEHFFLRGTTSLALSRYAEASADLRMAGQLLEKQADPTRLSLRLESTLALCAARMGLEDYEGALLTADSARALRPKDPRAILLRADALLASGSREDARKQLESALENASGVAAVEIRRRLDALR